MRRTLKLLLLLGVGLLMAKPKGGGDGPDGDGDGPDGGGEVDPLTGRPKDSEERQERLDFQGKNASTEMAEVHDTAKAKAETGRATDSNGDGQPDLQSQLDDMWDQREQANTNDPATAPEGESEPFGKYTPGDDEWNDSQVSLDELTEMTALHSDVDNPVRNRPDRALIEEALREGTPVKLPNQNAVKIKHDGVVVIVNYSDPTRSTTYFSGIDGGVPGG